MTMTQNAQGHRITSTFAIAWTTTIAAKYQKSWFDYEWCAKQRKAIFAFNIRLHRSDLCMRRLAAEDVRDEQTLDSK
jgi:hypothetical protein